MTAMYERLVDLLVDKFEVDRTNVRPGVTFEQLEMDSLFLVELLLVVQSEVGVAISEDTASPRDTLERAAELIEEQVAAATTTS
ncbi:acyl carrier protein [Streptomyces sp. SID13666]|uniref:phosphopantetheine-binding protein n=1 Tax=unclassified Streptomyces TaxID=2593676 RepID=UPI001106EED3|nr:MULTISPECIES: phosphopantetheine-binding protein [unclassified Streptomyces]NEA57190.1 acyl carrier protein [Streptomyces sp. SID13666]NEA74284.1 acyl carrier protein [Streptomyces sp. SID13588]QNA71956.1 acyl carrier protein [Streptomyces sp. So13.3]